MPMGRDEMLGMLLGMFAAKGRQEALLGSDLTPVRETFARMAPQKSEVHAYFETPSLVSGALTCTASSRGRWRSMRHR